MSVDYSNFIIYLYMFICFALLLYNIVYILLSKRRDNRRIRRADQWYRELETELKHMENGASVSPEHRKKMTQKLKNISCLMAYSDALQRGGEYYSEERMQSYLNEVHVPLQTLAAEYGKHPATERAYFAHLISIYCKTCDRQHTQLPRILLGYLTDSTIFCRENVLQALYALGHPDAVENALIIFQQEAWYHNPRLLSDGLTTFRGDREVLAKRLWKRCSEWNENLQVAVVQFITAVSDELAPEILAALENKTLLFEGQFALVRYFQRHVYPAAKPVLIDLLEEETASTLAIAAASALSRYPGEDTWQALMKSIHSRNYYVRKNSALSLVSLGASTVDVQSLRETGDNYASQMLEYVLHDRDARKTPPSSAETTKKG